MIWVPSYSCLSSKSIDSVWNNITRLTLACLILYSRLGLFPVFHNCPFFPAVHLPSPLLPTSPDHLEGLILSFPILELRLVITFYVFRIQSYGARLTFPSGRWEPRVTRLPAFHAFFFFSSLSFDLGSTHSIQFSHSNIRFASRRETFSIAAWHIPRRYNPKGGPFTRPDRPYCPACRTAFPSRGQVPARPGVARPFQPVPVYMPTCEWKCARLGMGREKRLLTMHC